MGDEGMIARDGLHNVVLLGTVARYEGFADPEELRAVLRRASSSRVADSPFGPAVVDAPAGDVDSPSAVQPSDCYEEGPPSNIKDSWAEAQLKLQLDDLQQQLEKERAAREKYARQLEKLAADWMEQVRSLKEFIHPLKTKMPTNPGTGMGALQLPSQATISSYGGDGSCLDSTTLTMMQQLKDDLSTRGPLFEDDADFIKEVAGGEVTAPDMQAQVELDRLRLKYEAWNKQFKSRLREAQAALKRGPKPQAAASSVSSGTSVIRSSVQIVGSNRPGVVNVSKMPNLYAPNLLC